MSTMVSFQDDAWEDYLYWQKTDKKILKRINFLVIEIKRHPFKVTGKPEPLKYDLSCYWSRRVNQEHRLVYRVDNKNIIIISCRYHY